MKKLISYVLLLALTLSLFAGCSIVPSGEPTEPPVVNESYLDSAKSILYQKYKPASKDEIPEKKNDFELMTTIDVAGAKHTVVWTIEVTSGDASAIKLVAGTKADYAQIVDVPDEPTEDILYTLTATISDYAGETVTISFKFKTPSYSNASLPNLPTVTAPVVGTAYKLGLIQVNLKKALYLDGTCGERYLNTTENKASSPDAYVEEAEGGFKIYIMVDGAKKYIEYFKNDAGKDCARLGETGDVFFYDRENCTWTTTIDAEKGENRSLVAYNDYATVGASWSGHTTAANVTITQFPLGFFPVDSVETVVLPDEPAVKDPEADTTLTIPAAIELGLSKVSGVYTSGKYYLVGEVTEIKNTQYGNLVIKDADGKTILIYGTYSADGADPFNAMTTQPAVGDTIKVYGVIGQYNGTAQMKNGWIVNITPAGSTPDPEPDPDPNPSTGDTLTIPEAITLGNSYAHDTYTTDKYYIVARIQAVTNATYGNMTLVDENGNTFTVYGTYDATGASKYGEITGDKPVAGDIVKVYGIIGKFSSTPQMKNGWIIEFTAHTCEFTTQTCEDASVCKYCGVENAPALGHLDENKDHVCERNCGITVGLHVDLNGDTVCDYGCSEKIEAGTAPVVGTLATFEFGANKSGAHNDGSEAGTSCTFEADGYKLNLTNMSKVYKDANDDKGNSCIKLGTSSVVGELTFEVPEEVTEVVIYVAKYKAKNTKITINGGTAQEISTSSNDGSYTEIKIDTTSNKTITLATVSGNTRCMINTIVFNGYAK